MNMWKMLEYGSWIVSVLILGWLLFDAIRVGKEYSNEFLLSSAEGEDEIVVELLKAEADRKKK